MKFQGKFVYSSDDHMIVMGASDYPLGLWCANNNFAKLITNINPVSAAKYNTKKNDIIFSNVFSTCKRQTNGR